MTEFVLSPHPDFPSQAIRSISGEVARGHHDNLELIYRVSGAIDEVLWPPLAEETGRADRLWEHSCFEVFVGRLGKPGYTELNLATSARWAAYAFDGYRAGMNAIEEAYVGFSCVFEPAEFELSASANLPILSQGQEWQVGVSAIIEAKDGTKSYWALAHAPGPPDFHNRDCFTARLAAPSAP